MASTNQSWEIVRTTTRSRGNSLTVSHDATSRCGRYEAAYRSGKPQSGVFGILTAARVAKDAEPFCRAGAVVDPVDAFEHDLQVCRQAASGQPVDQDCANRAQLRFGEAHGCDFDVRLALRTNGTVHLDVQPCPWAAERQPVIVILRIDRRGAISLALLAWTEANALGRSIDVYGGVFASVSSGDQSVPTQLLTH